MALNFAAPGWDFNFRNVATAASLAAGDANDIDLVSNSGGAAPLPQAGVYQNAAFADPPGYGWVLVPASYNGSGRSIDRRIWGQVNVTGGFNCFDVAVDPGEYLIRLVLGNSISANTQQGCFVIDPIDPNATGVNGILASGGGSVSANQNFFNAAGTGLYRCTTAGTYTTDVTGTGTGLAAGGTARFAFLAPVVLRLFMPAANLPSTSVLDTDNVVRTEAAWPTADNGKPVSVSVTCTSGILRVMRYPGVATSIRHFHVEQPPSQPLQDVTLLDLDGNPTAPITFYARQPQGKRMARLSVASGPPEAAAFTLGGTLASYFALATIEGAVWLVASANRLPDDATGTLTITQTDTSGNFTGSPYTTTFSTADSSIAIVSSQERPTDTSVLGLVRTETYLVHKRVIDKAATAFQGYSGTVFESDVAVNNDTELGTAIGNALSTAANGRRQRIRLRGTGVVYSASRFINGDFTGGGTGVLVIEDDAGHSPIITGVWQSNGVRGLHIRDVHYQAPNPSGTDQFLCLYPPTGAVYSTVFMERVRMDCSPNTAGHAVPVRCEGGESVVIRDCVFINAYDSIRFQNLHIAVSENNDFQRYVSDTHAVSRFPGQNTPPIRGVFADDHMYVLIRNNLKRLQRDQWTGYTQPDEPHSDLVQIRIVMLWWASGAAISGANVWRRHLNNYYRSTGAGTTGATPPTHTNGTVSDGGISWEFMGNVDSSFKVIMSLEENYCASRAQTYTDLGPGIWQTGNQAGQTFNAKWISGGFQFFINSGGGGLEVAAINNFSLSRIARGFIEGKTDGARYWVEYNAFVGSVTMPDVVSVHDGVNWYANQTLTGQGVVAEFNFAGSFTDLAVNDNNRVVGFRAGTASPNRPTDVFQGTSFATMPTTGLWEFELDESDTRTPAQVKADIRALFTPTAGNEIYGPRIAAEEPIPPDPQTFEFALNIEDAAGASAAFPIALTVVPA